MWACQGNSENLAFSPPIIRFENCRWRATPHSGSWSRNSCFLTKKNNFNEDRAGGNDDQLSPLFENILFLPTSSDIWRFTTRIKKWFTAWNNKRKLFRFLNQIMVLILISSSHNHLLIKVDKDQVWRNLDTTYEWVSHSLLIRSTWQIQLVLVTDTAHYCSLVISPLWPITMQHFQTTDQSEHSTQWHVTSVWPETLQCLMLQILIMMMVEQSMTTDNTGVMEQWSRYTPWPWQWCCWTDSVVDRFDKFFYDLCHNKIHTSLS